MRRHHYATMAAALGGLVLSAGLTAQPGGGPPPANVRLDAARLDTIEQYREVTGQLRALRRSVLAAEERGLVLEIALNEGDQVRAGQVIARLETSLASLQVQGAAANLASRRGVVLERETELEWRRRELTRMEEAGSRDSATPRELDDARTLVRTGEARLAEARADVQAAEVQLADAERRLSKLSIVAPFSGRVVRKLTEVGQWLDTGDSVVEILQLDVLEARLNVPESIIGSLVEGESVVMVSLPALGEQVTGKVTRVVPDADELSRLFPVRVELNNPDGRMRPGMSITGLVATTRRAPTLTISKDALLRDDAGEYVYFDAGGAAQVARVRRLFAVGDRVAIHQERLQPGMSVVVQGNERMFPGQPLKVIPGPAEAPGTGSAGASGNGG